MLQQCLSIEFIVFGIGYWYQVHQAVFFFDTFFNPLALEMDI